jgi:hypothetical protein
VHIKVTFVATSHRGPGQSFSVRLSRQWILIGIVNIKGVHDANVVHMNLGVISAHIIDSIVSRRFNGNDIEPIRTVNLRKPLGCRQMELRVHIKKVKLCVTDSTHDPYVVGHTAEHRPCGCHKVSLEEIATFDWILPPRETDLRVRLNELCTQNGMPAFGGSLETMSVSVILSMLSHTDMVVALPIDFARTFCENKTIAAVQIELGISSDNIGIVSKRHASMSPQLKQELEVFREMSRKLRLRVQ